MTLSPTSLDASSSINISHASWISASSSASRPSRFAGLETAGFLEAAGAAGGGGAFLFLRGGLRGRFVSAVSFCSEKVGEGVPFLQRDYYYCLGIIQRLWALYAVLVLVCRVFIVLVGGTARRFLSSAIRYRRLDKIRGVVFLPKK